MGIFWAVGFAPVLQRRGALVGATKLFSATSACEIYNPGPSL